MALPWSATAPLSGQNLQEHASYHSCFEVTTPTWNNLMTPFGMAREFLKYLSPIAG